MLKSCAEIIMIFLTTLILSCNAFWWRSSTEATPVIKQIPVGYFRTYTYHQPMTYPGSFYNTPFNNYQANRFSGWSQFPSSSNGAPILSNYKYETQSPILTAPSTQAPTPQPPPPTPAPTQPPPPPPQPQYQPPPAPVSASSSSSSSSSNSIITTSIGHTFIETQPPVSQHISTGAIRTSYPTPDFPKYQYYYSNSPSTNNVHHQKPMQQIRFVPCMCPVTVSVSSDYAENRSASLDDNDMDLPENDNDDNNNDGGSVGVKSKESSGDDAIVK